MEPERGTAAAASSSATSKPNNNNTAKRDKEIVYYNADAGLLNDFEQSAVSGKSFDYTKSMLNPNEPVPEEHISAYLSRIQRGALVQSFGCMLAIDEPTFKIICFSENCFEFLGLTGMFESKEVRTLIGVDVKTLFTPSSGASLAKLASSREMSLLNPIWVYTRTTQKPFYAILHRIDVGVVIDLEPAKSVDPALSLAGAVQSQKLAVRAISRLQSLPAGNIGALCDTVVEDVQKLTGYDRVMMYKFHEDDHGEVVAEVRRSDLESYLGLHYPATDIPQAARFLFKQNRVRMICDCNANPVKLVQSEELDQPLCLVNSTLRSPHDCHRQYMSNMGSIASLVMAVTINSPSSSKLYGLVVCHHTSPRYVAFPLRYACEFLMQAFGLQLNMELQLALQLAEKKILKTQTLLCDMLLRDAPSGIVTQSPSIMDLVKCDGAALCYNGTCWLMGVTPTESQVKDIVEWLLKNHEDSTGLSTDSLAEAGYPSAALLGNAVCGMATARISPKNFLFWFRSHTAEEVKWGGAKHHPQDKDDGGRMNPRSSFKAFLEVVKSRSLAWEVSEINAIHSLQLIMRDSFQDMEEAGPKAISNVPQAPRDTKMQLNEMDKISSVACEMVRLIETAQVPIFGIDTDGLINGWNQKTAELTGLKDGEAMGKSLVNDIVHEDSREAFQYILSKALAGHEDKNIELKLRNFGLPQQNEVIYIVANSCTSRNHANNVVGVCFVGQDVTCEKLVTEKFIQLQGDYKAIIQNLNPLIPPIFASDENAYCSEWNAAMEKLTGVTRDDAIGKMLPGEIFGEFCRLKGEDPLTRFRIVLYQGISGNDIEKFPFAFFDRKGEYVQAYLTASKRTNANGNVTGCFCFLQIHQPNMQQAIEGLAQEDDKCSSKFKELTYLRQEMKNPLNGIRFTHKLLESTINSEYQKQFLDTSDACERQIMTILDNLDMKSIEEGNVELNMEEFLLGTLLDAIVSQSMIPLRERNLQLLHEIPEEIKSLSLLGDQIKLQLVLSDFLLNVVYHTPSPNGWVEIRVSPDLKLIQDGNSYIHLQFRMTHPGQGIPTALIQDMFDGGNRCTTQEGIGLNLSRKLLSKMNGRVQYIREHDECYFLIGIELGTRT